MTTTKVSPGTRAEVTRLLAIVPLSAEAMARISRARPRGRRCRARRAGGRRRCRVRHGHVAGTCNHRLAPTVRALDARRAGGREREPKQPGPARHGGAALNHGGASWGCRAGGAKRSSSAGIVEQMFDVWLAAAKPGAKLVYHRGLLAADKVHDPHLARLADRLLELSNGRYDVLSACGHIRGEIRGSGQIELFTRREHGATVYLAVKR